MKVKTLDQPVLGHVIKKAIESNDFLGLRLDQLLILYLGINDIRLDKEHCFSLSELKVPLSRIFNERTVDNVIDLIEDSIKAQYYD